MKEPIGIPVKGDKEYTVSGLNVKGVVFYDRNGKEVGVCLFENRKKGSQTFNVPSECLGIKFKY